MPKTIIKEVHDVISAILPTEEKKLPKAPEKMGYREREKVLATLEKEMKEAARRLDFEEAAQIRDMIMEIRAASRK